MDYLLDSESKLSFLLVTCLEQLFNFFSPWIARLENRGNLPLMVKIKWLNPYKVPRKFGLEKGTSNMLTKKLWSGLIYNNPKLERTKCPPLAEGTHESWYNHTVEYHAAMKKNGSLTPMTTQDSLTGSERMRTWKSTHSHVHEVQEQAKLIYCDESQKKSYLRRVLPARGGEGTFRAAGEILYLDLGGDYASIHTGENSLICTLQDVCLILCVCYISILRVH